MKKLFLYLLLLPAFANAQTPRTLSRQITALQNSKFNKADTTIYQRKPAPGFNFLSPAQLTRLNTLSWVPASDPGWVTAGQVASAPKAYSALTGTPVIPVAVTNTNQLTNGAGYQTGPDVVSAVNAAIAPYTVTSLVSTTATALTITTATGPVILLINPAATLPSLSVTLPVSVPQNQTVRLIFGGAITSGTVVNSLTVLPASGQSILQPTQPGTVLAGESITYQFNSTTSKWYRLY